MSCLPQRDLVNLRLVCHDFCNRLAPTVFEDLTVNFRSRTFSRPAKLAALDRIGYLVKNLTFVVPCTKETLLPPLIDPWTGEEKEFVYPSQLHSPTAHGTGSKQPKYGDWATTDLLIKQYPPLFHAATNTDAFVRVVSTFINLSHLKISCPGESSTHISTQRSVVDYVLISLRIAFERTCLNSLQTMTLLHMDPCKLPYLLPTSNRDVRPASRRTWSMIRTLKMHLPCPRQARSESSTLKSLHDYLGHFAHLEHFDFCWAGGKGPSPLPLSFSDLFPKSPRRHPSVTRAAISPPSSRHPVHRPRDNHQVDPRPQASPSLFPHLTHLSIENAILPASQIRNLISAHRHTLEDLYLESISVIDGTWDDAFEPLDDISGGDKRSKPVEEMGDVPIMLAPSMLAGEKKKKVRMNSTIQIRNCDGSEGRRTVDQRTKATPNYCRNKIVGASDAAEGVRTLLLSGAEQPKKAKRKKRDFWACNGVIKAIKGGLLKWP